MAETNVHSEVEITYAEEGSKGRFAARVAGIEAEAELVIRKVSPEEVIAVHTIVPDALGGRGIAKQLALALIADARAKGHKIIPQCPFVKAYAQKHKQDLADVIQW